eukprot:TRINITY_DN16081_c0_g1_i1.p1 TRINITY_DN16081_c0_g1~~TRINITY_DN16081_c0_g1_i1.p1  ORF type:complete len:504 (+),score=129.44 TRINITY_DN16081_c0_g1_i1:90-1514(+)
MSQTLDRLQDSVRFRVAGCNQWGECGHDMSVETIYRPLPVAGLDSAVSIAAGRSMTAVLTAQGEVLTAGWNDFGQLGRGGADEEHHPELRAVSLPCPAAGVACGDGFLLICLRDGRVAACGNNRFCQCGGDELGYDTPALVPAIAAAERVFAGSLCSFVLCHSGSVFSFGANSMGQLCQGATNRKRPPQKAVALCGVGVREISLGWTHGLALLEDGGILAWGRLTDRLASGSSSWDTARGGVPIRLNFGGAVLRAVSASAGQEHCAVATEDGRLWLWGSGASRALGFGALADVAEPAPLSLPGGERAVAVQCSWHCTFATAADGRVFACGQRHCGLPFGAAEREGEDADAVTALTEVPFRCVVFTGPCASHVFYRGGPPAGVLRVGAAELADSELDVPLGDVGVAAEATVHLLRFPSSASAAGSGPAAEGGQLQVYVDATAVGAEGLLCIELRAEATARDLAAAAVEQLQRAAP